MLYPRLACACFTSLSIASSVYAQETTYVFLKTCPGVTTPNDPSIEISSVVGSNDSCETGRVIKRVVVDRLYGFEIAAKTVRDIPGKPRRVVPDERDVFATHKPCRVAYPSEGVVIEWLVPKVHVCDGRPAGSYVRVYTPHEICLRPGQGCIAVHNLDPVGQERYSKMVRIAYERLVANSH